MPTSFIHAVPTIVETVTALSPESILDIGIGFGKYGVLLREALGVAHLRYHREDWKIHDVVLCIDVLEHFEKEKGKKTDRGTPQACEAIPSHLYTPISCSPGGILRQSL